ncbi:MAG: hypothetical protein GXO50_05620 [Chlorobi bacterium]|nr:hypothetical protein [Chlorobiota bacterium]
MKPCAVCFFILITFSGFSQNSYKPEYRLEPSDSCLVNFDVYSQSTQKVGDDEQTVSSEKHIVYTFGIGLNGDSSFTVSVRFKKINEEIKDRFGQKRYFSSDSDMNSVSEVYSVFLQTPLKFKLNRKGGLKELYNPDSLFADKESAKQIFKRSVDKKIIHGLPVQVVFPENAVVEGESWKVSDTGEFEFFKIYDKTFTLDSADTEHFFISEKALISSDKNRRIQMNGVFVSYDMTGKLYGNYLINRKNGIAEKVTIKLRSYGNVFMRYSENSEPAYDWTIDISEVKNIRTEKFKK